MKKIKKWQIIILILLGVVGYWISNNTWIFQENVEPENYERVLIDSEWESKSGGKWNFNSNYELVVNNGDYERIQNWKLDNTSLITKGINDRLPSVWEIKTFRDSFIEMTLISPPLNGRRPQKKLIKQNEK
ncbi:MAG: hypothetical protein MRY83_11860 [Flavobacteriales bacterium]|nr:hypothetical protein [Flavobacteriales bacterium]